MDLTFLFGVISSFSLLAIACLILLAFGYRSNVAAGNAEFWRYPILLGTVMGIVAFAVLAFPISLGLGGSVDTRAAPLLLSGLLGGPIAAAVSTAIAIAAVTLLEGPAQVAAGQLVAMCLYGAVGAIAGKISRDHTGNRPTAVMLAALSVMALVIMICSHWLFGLPGAARGPFSQVWPVFLAANGAGIFLFGLAYRVVLEFKEDKHALERTLAASRMARQAGGIGVWQVDLNMSEINWDDRMHELHRVDKSPGGVTLRELDASIHPDDLASQQSTFVNAIASSEPFSSRFRIGGQHDGTGAGRRATDASSSIPIPASERPSAFSGM